MDLALPYIFCMHYIEPGSNHTTIRPPSNLELQIHDLEEIFLDMEKKLKKGKTLLNSIISDIDSDYTIG